MKNALIGYTGFVGGNLLSQTEFSFLYNSKNIEDAQGQSFDLLVCAGAPAEKWKANQQPEADRAALGRLCSVLAKVRARRVVLISTIDVYPNPLGVDEDTFFEPGAAAYGRHRFLLEKFVQDHFDALILRLPGLFGPGLKKNIIYDFLHDNQVAQIDSRGVFQFYDLANLWRDVMRASDAGLRVLNVATEPVGVEELVSYAFGKTFRNEPPDRTPARYDMRSVHASLFGGSRGYLYDRQAVLDAAKAFVRDAKKP